MGLFLKANGYYYAEITINNKRIQKSLRTKSKIFAQDLYHVLLREKILQSFFPNSSKNTLLPSAPPIEIKQDTSKTRFISNAIDKGLDLILIDAQFKYWYRDLLRDLDGQFPPPPESLEGPSPYCATYWNSSNNTYYHVYSRMEKTNNIQYSLDTNQQHEALLYSGLLEYFSAEDLPILTNSTLSNLADTYFLYAGSISETERLYINSVNNDQYLKELRITDTTMYTSSNYNIIEGVPLDSPIGPVIIINEYNSTNVIYTNKSRVFNMDSTIQEISYPENSKVIESD